MGNFQHLAVGEILESRTLLTEFGLAADVAGLAGSGVVSDNLSINEDTTITANLITGTNGASADQFDGPVTLISVTQPAHGSVTFQPDGTLTYTPIPDYNGNDFFDYTVDTGATTETARVFMSIAPEYDIHNDILITNTNVPVTDNLITRDGSHDDFEGTPQVVSVTQGQHGSVSFMADGTVTYQPDLDFVGEDKFTYTVESGGVTESAIVFVFMNVPEFLTPDKLITGMETPITANVILGTNGASRDPLTVEPYLYQVSQPTHGTVTFSHDGTITYTPNAGFIGVDRFTYMVPVGTRSEGTTVDVTVSDAFRLVSDALTIDEDSPITANVLTGTNGASADFFAGPATLTSVVQPEHGTVTFLPDGTITYTPLADYYGTDQFFYTVSTAGLLPTTRVVLNVRPVTDTTDDTLAAVSGIETLYNLITGTNGAAADHFEGTPTIASVTQPEHGTVTILTDGNVFYRANTGYIGSDTFTYTVESGGVPETANVTVSVIAPYSINADSLTLDEDKQITANLMTGTHGATADVVSATATLISTTQPDHGNVVFQANGTITYTPDADFNGVDSFYYTVDVGAGTSFGLVTIRVLPIADLVADTLTTQEGIPVTANLITGTGGASADRFEGTPTLGNVSSALYGSVTFLPDGTFTYTPVVGFSGQDQVLYSIFSGGSREDGIVTIHVASNGTATADFLTLNEDTSITANVVTGTNGATSDHFIVPVTLTSVTQAVFGTVAFSADGTVTYTPNPDFNGEDQFFYTVTTPTGLQTAAVTLHVKPVADIVSDAPIVAAETPTKFNVITGANGATADNFEGVPILSSLTQGTNGSVSGGTDGSVTYTPRPGFVGRDTFTYTVTSGNVAETATVTVTVASSTPQILLNSPTGTYHLGRKVAYVDPKVVYVPGFGSEPDFSQAILTATVTAGRTKRTILSIRAKGNDTGEINLDGKKVRYGSVEIGSYQGGKGKHPDLVVHLNANATSAAVEDLLQRINYQNSQPVPSATVRMQITNISSQDTNAASRQFEIVGPPERTERGTSRAKSHSQRAN